MDATILAAFASFLALIAAWLILPQPALRREKQVAVSLDPTPAGA